MYVCMLCKQFWAIISSRFDFVCVGTAVSFAANKSSSETVAKRGDKLPPIQKQWIAKYIPGYGSQLKRAKIAIHWFGKYWN